MLEQTQPGRCSVRSGALVLSLALHLAVIGGLMYRPEPKLLQPTSSLRGNGGGMRSVISLVAPGVSAQASPKEQKPTEDRKALSIQRSQARKASSPPATATKQSNNPGVPGFVLGSVSNGFADDHDVRIAIPTLAPDPPVIRAKLPEWIRGDVIVEVTISEDGAVVETKVLHTVGFGLEDSIVETLRRWRFTPALVDGVAVASRQDVHFHFPS